MAPASSSYKPPQLLHWRGLTRWCVGSRVPSLCEMVMEARSSSAKLSLQMVGKLVLSSSHVRLRASPSSSSSPAPRKLQARTATCTGGDGAPPTAQHGASKNKKSPHELDRSASSAAQRRGGEGKQVLFDMVASCSRARADVVECAESSNGSRKVRVMARSSSCPNPSRSCREGRSGDQGWMQTLQRRSDAIAGAAAGILGHSRSSSSYRRFSVDGGGTSSSSRRGGGGVAKLGGGGYGRPASGGGRRVDHQHQQAAVVPMHLREMERKYSPLVAELVMGNQFLARVYPAPPLSASSSSAAALSPSPGLLFLKPPPPHLADRLIFFA